MVENLIKYILINKYKKKITERERQGRGEAKGKKL